MNKIILINAKCVALILVGVGWCSSPGFSGEELFYRNDFS